MLIFGEAVGTIATIVGLIGGPLFYISWPDIKNKIHPFICPKCGSKESEFNNREIESRDVPKPVHRSDIVHYNTSNFIGNDRSLINRVEQIYVKRTTYEKFRKCNKCGDIQSNRTFTVDTNISFSDVRSAVL